MRCAIPDYISSIVTQLLSCLDESAGSVPPIRSVLSLLGEFLVGSIEEATPVVRGSTYRAILAIVRHHAGYLLTNDCTLVLELVQRGVFDKDRSSRLLAGYVFTKSWIWQ